MKVATYSLLTLMFSALIFTPSPSPSYSQNKFKEKNESVLYKERRLDKLLKAMEYQVVKDSLEIQSLKNNHN